MRINRSSCGVTIAVLCTAGVTASSFILNPPRTITTSKDSFRPRDVLLPPPRGGAQSRGLARVKAAAAAEDEESNKQTIATATFNLIKGCVGAGVLSLPAGVAAIGDVPKA